MARTCTVQRWKLARLADANLHARSTTGHQPGWYAPAWVPYLQMDTSQAGRGQT